MLDLAIILIVAGVISAIYGNSLNNSIEAQLKSVFSNGSANPGNIWLILGVIAIIIGIILLVVALKKKK